MKKEMENQIENQIVWKDRFNLGVEVIDREHQKLFKIINKLFAFAGDEEKNQWVCKERIKYFKDHAIKHFADEEAYMISIHYDGFKVHKRIHDDFRDNTLPALEQELEHTLYSEDAVSHFLSVCTGWLIGHTLTEDHAIIGAKSSKWANLLPEEIHKAMIEALQRSFYDIFQMDANVISESYGGEKFGNGIYYRLTYLNGENKKWETFLVFEEKLLINTVGKMMGLKIKKVNVTLVNAVRYMARQFVERIMRHFPSSEQYALKSENLLSFEQFQKVFEKEKLQSSLLFNTEEGYFAYCTVAPHLNEGRIGGMIPTEKVMDEVGKYLERNEEEQEEISRRKKILVVDDSNFMLKVLGDLLGQDYEVSLVQSGMAAIRSLTLNRPDLILLDYEMPVCDGKQVLEMIRSETEIADIAVIFLTGRVDKESVRNVLALKPAGYLSKNLAPEEIKKNVDEYFNGQGN